MTYQLLSSTNLFPNPQTIKMFADDIKMYAVFNDIQDVCFLQSSLDLIAAWCETWQLKINVQKSNVLHLGSKNPKYNYFIFSSSVPVTDSPWDLLILMDPKLKFSDDIVMITAKARSRCMVYLKNFTTREPTLMKMFLPLMFAQY